MPSPPPFIPSTGTTIHHRGKRSAQTALLLPGHTSQKLFCATVGWAVNGFLLRVSHCHKRHKLGADGRANNDDDNDESAIIMGLFLGSACILGLGTAVLCYSVGIWSWMKDKDAWKRALLYMHWARPPLCWRSARVEGHHCFENVEIKGKHNLLAALIAYPGGKDVYQRKFTNRERIPGDTNDTRTVVVFLHGRAGTRSRDFLLDEYLSIAGNFDAAVLAIDYQGFAENRGFPDREHLQDDAMDAYKYAVYEMNAEMVVVWGQSLGSGIGADLVRRLQEMPFNHPMAQPLQSLVLEAPYTSMVDAFMSHWLSAQVRRLCGEALARHFAEWLIPDKWDTKSFIGDLDLPILIMHAKNDRTIPFRHGEQLAGVFQNAAQTIGGQRMCFFYNPSDGGHGRLCYTSQFGETLRNFKEMTGMYAEDGVAVVE